MSRLHRDPLTYSDASVLETIKGKLTQRAQVRLQIMRAVVAAQKATSDAFFQTQFDLTQEIREMKRLRDIASLGDQDRHSKGIVSAQAKLLALRAMRQSASTLNESAVDRVTADAIAAVRKGHVFVDFKPDFDSRGNDEKALKEALLNAEKAVKAIRAVNIAAIPADDVIAQIHREVDNFAAAGAPDLRAALRPSQNEVGDYRPGKTRWPKSYTGGDKFVPDGFHLMFWAFKDQIKERLAAEVRTLTKGETAIPLDQRAAKIKTLEAEKLRAERIASEIAWRLNDEGQDIKLYSDDFRAVLGVKIGTRK